MGGRCDAPNAVGAVAATVVVALHRGPRVGTVAADGRRACEATTGPRGHSLTSQPVAADKRPISIDYVA